MAESFTNITTGQVDAGSPFDATLAQALSNNTKFLKHLQELFTWGIEDGNFTVTDGETDGQTK